MTSWVAQEAVNSQARFQLSCIFQMWRGLLHKIKVWTKHGEDQREQGSGSHQQRRQLILLHQAILLQAPESCCKMAVPPAAPGFPVFRVSWRHQPAHFSTVSPGEPTLLAPTPSWEKGLASTFLFCAECILPPDLSTLTTANPGEGSLGDAVSG